MGRYRFVETSTDVVTSNHVQYRDIIRGRFNIDRGHRYTIGAGISSGTTFVSSWNNTGVGTGDLMTNHSLRILYGSAIPIPGLELQYGGLYIARGESTEITTYDDDGYVVGERVSIRRPKDLFFDEIAATRGLVGPFSTPSLTKRWRGLHEANYRQFLLAKRVGGHIRTSGDYTYDSGAETLLAAVAVGFAPGAPVAALRYEQYWRVRVNPAAGFSVSVERPVGKRFRLQAGYATIDEFYGGWNADRIQRGKRVFAVGTLPLTRELTLALFATQAFDGAYTLSNRTRTDVILTYDLLRTLQNARVF